jgi:hypothetical protein
MHNIRLFFKNNLFHTIIRVKLHTLEIINKIKRRFFLNACDSMNDRFSLLTLAKAFLKILESQKAKTNLITAYTDINIANYNEDLSDIGFIIKDPFFTFFDGNPNDPHHPYNPIENLKKNEFDIILGSEGLDLYFFAKSFKQALKEIKLCNFQTCLNVNKISIIAAIICLIPSNTNIIEIGSYQGGTTIFMAKLAKILNKNLKIFACDTFEGMPPASDNDKIDKCFYDSGRFIDNPLKKVQKRIKREKLENSINLVKGDVTITLKNLNINNLSFVFLDTDQYNGTKAGLDFVLHSKSKPHIIIDDSSLSGINIAINEFLENNSSYRRKNLITNFDYLIPDEAW